MYLLVESVELFETCTLFKPFESNGLQTNATNPQRSVAQRRRLLRRAARCEAAAILIRMEYSNGVRTVFEWCSYICFSKHIYIYIYKKYIYINLYKYMNILIWIYIFGWIIGCI